MNTYAFFNFDWECPRNEKLMHKTKFTKDQFELLVQASIKEATDFIENKQDTLCSILEDMSKYTQKEIETAMKNSTMDSLMTVTLGILKSKYGFIVYEPEFTFAFGILSNGGEISDYNKVLPVQSI